MWDSAGDLAGVIENAATGLAGAITGAAPGWLVLGVMLHVSNQLARGRGWYAVVRRACPDDPRLRVRDTIGAWVAGAGAGGVASARGGDALRVFMLDRRLTGTGPALLAGTLVAECAGETPSGVALLGTALAAGVGPEVGIDAQLARPGCSAARRCWSPPARCCGAGRRPVASAPASAAAAPPSDARAPTRAACSRGSSPAAWRAPPRSRCFLAAFHLPATPARRPARDGRPGRRAARAARARVRSAPSVGDARRELRPGHRHQVSTRRLAAFFVGTSTVLSLVGLALAPRRRDDDPGPGPGTRPAADPCRA